MIRTFARTVSAAAALLLLADGLAAQSLRIPRVTLVPQVGASVNHSRLADATTMASLGAEVQVWRGLSLSLDGAAATADYTPLTCNEAGATNVVCAASTGIRASASAGVMVRPFRVGPLAPYAGASAGWARWKRDVWTGTAPHAALRAGVDVRVRGPLGVRADFARRMLWSDQVEFSPVYLDVVSVGASFSVRR